MTPFIVAVCEVFCNLILIFVFVFHPWHWHWLVDVAGKLFTSVEAFVTITYPIIRLRIFDTCQTYIDLFLLGSRRRVACHWIEKSFRRASQTGLISI